MGRDGKLWKVQWEDIRRRLLYDLGAERYIERIEPLQLIGADDDTVHLAAPNPVVRDTARGECGPRILELWQKENPDICHLDILADQAPVRMRDSFRGSKVVRGFS